jgi:hypothetical protein
MTDRTRSLIAVTTLAALAGGVWIWRSDRSIPTKPVRSAAAREVEPAAPVSGSREVAAPEPSWPRARSATPVASRPFDDAAATRPRVDRVLVYGSVRDDGGNPVNQGQVLWRRNDDDVSRNTAIDDGAYAIQLPPGSWIATTASGTFPRTESRFELSPEVPRHRLDFALRRPWRVAVRARTSDGRPLAEVVGRGFRAPELVAIATQSEPPADLPVSGDRYLAGVGAGRFRATRGGDAVGTLDLHVAPPLFVTLCAGSGVLATKALSSVVSEIEFEVDAAAFNARLGSVKARLVDAATGRPLADYAVALSTPSSSGPSERTDANGVAAYSGLAAGVYLFDTSPWTETVPPEGPREAFVFNVKVGAGETVDLGELRLAAPAVVAGTVEGVVEGEETYISLVPFHRLRDEASFSGSLTKLGPQGRFEFKNAPRGRVLLLVRRKDGATAAASADAAGGEARDVRLRFGVVTKVVFSWRGEWPDTLSITRDDGMPFFRRIVVSEFPFPVKLPPGRYTATIGGATRAFEVAMSPLYIELAP